LRSRSPAHSEDLEAAEVVLLPAAAAVDDRRRVAERADVVVDPQAIRALRDQHVATGRAGLRVAHRAGEPDRLHAPRLVRVERGEARRLELLDALFGRRRRRRRRQRRHAERVAVAHERQRLHAALVVPVDREIRVGLLAQPEAAVGRGPRERVGRDRDLPERGREDQHEAVGDALQRARRHADPSLAVGAEPRLRRGLR
jgi:hypothetical protein